MPASTDHHGARILIVDDQPSNVRLLEHTLARGGFVAVSSTDDPSAVAALHRENRYALIILDLQMPEMNGFEVMQALQEMAATHPVTILVMSAGSTQKAAALEGGATRFLEKPFVLADVVNLVTSMLEAAGGDRGGTGDDGSGEARDAGA